MKVKAINIHNFKRFEQLEVSFENRALHEVSNRFLVLGDNGTGKTTLLQAVALPLALATRQIQSISDFDWIGFVPGRYARWERPRIELTVSFSDAEIAATRRVAKLWYDALPEDVKYRQPFVEPDSSPVVQLTLDGDSCRATTREEFLQFQGRYYARRLLETDPGARRFFSDLPGVFWFDQFRNLGSSLHPAEADGNASREGVGRASYDFGVARLRHYLTGWQLAHLTKSYKVDYLMQLENQYKRVFHGRSFAGVEPMPDVSSPTAEDYYFLLNDGNRTYDVVEMSAGEQAVFPILFEFVRQQIANSVVLVDEIDLNLHPPAAQLLVTQLPKIGPTCQFIFTTHSEAVSELIGEDETYRLPGGSLCL